MDIFLHLNHNSVIGINKFNFRIFWNKEYLSFICGWNEGIWIRVGRPWMRIWIRIRQDVASPPRSLTTTLDPDPELSILLNPDPSILLNPDPYPACCWIRVRIRSKPRFIMTKWKNLVDFFCLSTTVRYVFAQTVQKRSFFLFLLFWVYLTQLNTDPDPRHGIQYSLLCSILLYSTSIAR